MKWFEEFFGNNASVYDFHQDLQDHFRDIEQAYLDTTHYTPKANKFLAEKVYEVFLSPSGTDSVSGSAR